MLYSIMQYIGAALVLAGFATAAQGWLAPTSPANLMLNLTGAVFLMISAHKARQWGFFGLNAVWTGVALFGLLSQMGR